MFQKKCVFVLLVVVLMCSCVSRQQLAYLRDVTSESVNEINKNMQTQPETRVKITDALVITVSALDPEAVLPYNLPNVAYATPTSENIPTTPSFQYYTVDANGDIDFPVLGPLEVAGMTRWELAEMIKTKLIKGGLLTDAVVTVEFMNFKVSVLGEVNAPGTYTIEGDKVTVLQAISLARDLTIFGMRENVSVIRERDGERTIYQINLCDVNLFKSPAYYLQQNDIIYVEPNKEKARQSTTDDKTLRMTSIFVSGGSLVVSIATLVTSILLNK